ncbi:MAG: polyprenyl synthetase family protein [Lachnospiraceae bacterium]|nr:polyprenyl synthetase family protein [Lachnospiraceae bacterium]
MDLKTELQKRIEEIESVIVGYLPEEAGYQKTVIEAMNYSVLAGGKRIRPMLMQETYRLFGGTGNIVEPFMCALEMIHTYSLVHDDLPAMDNDEYRRGKKTTHAVYGETMGILAGDGLLNYAFEVVSSAFDIECSENVAKAMQILAKKAGIYGMIGGQVADIESENKSVGIETIEFIHKMKTGALIESAMLIGAVLAGATDEDMQKIEQIATDIGVAFQIQDDILDLTSTTEVLGKPVGSDEKNHKSTYVSLKGLEQSKKDVEYLSNRALDTLASLPGENAFLEELIRMLIVREK